MNFDQRLEFIDLPLQGLQRIKHKKISDERGYLSRLYCYKELSPTLWNSSVAQINLIHTANKGTVRGMHFQHPPFSENKIINCIRGSIYDVVIDLRKNSKTFLKWHAEKISSENNDSILIPAGFAHGYQSLTDDVLMVYLHSQEHNPKSEDGLNLKDPSLSIDWPLDITNLSDRDKNHPYLSKDFKGIVL